MILKSLLIYFLGFTLISLHVFADDGKYPISNPYFATLSTLLINPENYQYKTATLEPHPERRHLPGIRVTNQLTYTYKIQDPTAPLVFILPGLGSDAKSSMALLIADVVARLGYNVVTVPDGFSWQFSIGGSSFGVVGYAPQDAKDLYEFLKMVRRDLGLKTNLVTQRFALIGYSMGALEAGFLLQLDRLSGDFQFQRTLLINPPLHIRHAVTTLDSLAKMKEKLSPARQSWLMGYLFDFYMTAAKMLKNGASLTDVLAQSKITEDDAKWLIGESFHQSLTDVILASQQVHDAGVLKTPINHFNAREEEAQKFSFEDYILRFFIPQMSTLGTVEEFYPAGSLTALFNFFSDDPSIYVMHNEDDFLFESDLKSKLQDTFKDRLLLFAHGGHMGNLWYPENLKDIAEIMFGL